MLLTLVLLLLLECILAYLHLPIPLARRSGELRLHHRRRYPTRHGLLLHTSASHPYRQHYRKRRPRRLLLTISVTPLSSDLSRLRLLLGNCSGGGIGGV